NRRLRASIHAGVDPGAGPAPPSADRIGRSPPLPAARESHPLLRLLAAAFLGPAGPERPRRAGAVGPWHLRRPPDRRRPDLRRRGLRHRPTTASRPRVLAAEAPRRRPRRDQRAWTDLRAGLPRLAGEHRPDEPVDARPRRPAGPRRRP